MNSHSQQSAKHSAIIRTWGQSSLGVNKVRFAYIEDRALCAKGLYMCRYRK
jgi:hypothetical protein